MFRKILAKKKVSIFRLELLNYVIEPLKKHKFSPLTPQKEQEKEVEKGNKPVPS